jgi:glycosyltransferase involved in cell wall biosynthesis
MRVVMLLPELKLRGSIRRSFMLSAGLIDAGHRVIVSSPGGQLAPLFERLHARIINWRPAAAGRNAGFFPAMDLARLLDNHEPDIIHVGSLTWPTPWRVLQHAIGCPLVATVHSAKDAARIGHRTLSRFDEIIAVSAAGKEALVASGLPRNRVSLILPGAPALVAAGDASAVACRHANNVPVIACIGPMVDEAAVETLLLAARRLIKAGTQLRVLCAGVGDVAPFVRKWVAEHDAAHWAVLLEELFDPDAAYEVADIVVAPSDSLDSVQFALEAMGRGIPAVFASTGGNPEMVENGASALLYEPGDLMALGDALDHLIRDKTFAGYIAAGGIRRIEKHFRLERLVKDTLATYERCLDTSEGAGWRAKADAARSTTLLPPAVSARLK